MHIEIQGKKIYYERLGRRGTAILLVHGWGGTSASLKPLAAILSKKYDTITLDLPGFGRSDNPDPSWGVGEYGRFLKEFISELELKKVIYFGHSFGGTLGIFLAANYPQLIDRLILSAPSFKRVRRAHTMTKALKAMFNLLPFAKSGQGLVKKLYYRIFFPRSDMTKLPYLDENLRKIMTQDLTPATLKVTVPTLILWGDNDTYVDITNATELHNNITGSKLKIFKDEKHGLPLKKPAVVAKEIEKFLNI